MAQPNDDPFGEEVTTTGNQQTIDDKKFTGHQRDTLGTPGVADDIDYMHARFYSPLLGRFLSTDPVLGRPRAPQSWNRYSYVRGNPILLTDPTGLKDLKKTADKALLEDPQVLQVVGDIVKITNFSAPLAKRVEAGAVIVTDGNGDFNAEGGAKTDNDIGKVSLTLGRNSDGEVTSASGRELAATMHSHVGTGKVPIPGGEKVLFAAFPSKADKVQASVTGKPVFILAGTSFLMKLESTGPSTYTTSRMLTGSDYADWLTRAAAATSEQK
ncbi:MAG: RHS repeat-associated core domain-containing protein [Holophagales bacterium]|nr:MAG: RHS repeat-associated core domain-containing protein [Holophagales bacterium]